ncbi:D-alanyl-D-alanine carboxypeptidase [Nocardia transvalensis]|uniref:D-alanyl-D-alanine carboxypeptidase n=1 Tax=Nocardia transvalensis TaxID=37333 RepID=A0A7W9UHM9_9NOCA|nr:serine hydrolase domain-containing protein [Nocardia transvalensis]MBB5913247.1 D-alanyl-D-alanine carboxypeptidase [Nocardia transvalensis]
MPGYARLFGALCAAAVTLSACATETRVDTAAPPGYSDARDILRRLTTADGAPGALLGIDGRRGRTVLTSGVADIRTRAPMAGDSRFRIGSMTKTFVATVVLQLVGEDKIVLDAPIETYLPGLIRGNGNDGHDITVRQLLQQTSGLPDYLDSLDLRQVLKTPLTHYDPTQLVQLALAHPRLYPPGTGWNYSNTNYVLAGLLIEKVTGHPFGDEITRRVIQPLDLRDTSVPGDRTTIPGPHPQGYSKPDDSLVDLTDFNPSIAYASGEIISSATDMNQFLAALLNGRLLHPTELQAMTTTRPTGDPSGNAYGLGLISTPLPCGGLYWGHDGDIPGFSTVSGTTPAGHTATIMTTLAPGGPDAQSKDMRTALAAALCTAPAEPAP